MPLKEPQAEKYIFATSFLGSCEQDAMAKPPFTPLRYKNINMQCWQPCNKTCTLLHCQWECTVTGSFWKLGVIIYQKP